MVGEQRQNYSAWDLALLEGDARTDFAEVARCIVGYAHLAPNTHNTQPWRFEANVATNEVSVFLEQRRVLSESDKVGRQAHVSIGAAIKNMEIAAQSMGWKVDIVITPNHGDHVVTARFEYTGIPGPIGFLADSITKRITNRGRYDRTQKLSDMDEENLQTIAKNHDVKLRLIKDQLSKAAIADLQEKADSVVINNPTFARELADWIITEDSDSGLGMPGSGFGLAPDKIPGVIDSLRNGLSADLDLRKALPQADREGINSAFAELVILTEDDSLVSRLHAGMTYQHISLELTTIGWATAMNAAFVEVRAFGLLLKTRLQEFRNIPMVVCRIGMPLPPESGEVKRGHSPRLPLTEVFALK